MIHKIDPVRVLHCKRFGEAVGVSTDAHRQRDRTDFLPSTSDAEGNNIISNIY